MAAEQTCHPHVPPDWSVVQPLQLTLSIYRVLPVGGTLWLERAASEQVVSLLQEDLAQSDDELVLS